MPHKLPTKMKVMVPCSRVCNYMIKLQI